uniref:ARAD1B03916p n=1 Tax=Blastobotrys adeninivorans TaxID=409370 RepID=A0A060T5E4_BLAAD
MRTVGPLEMYSVRRNQLRLNSVVIVAAQYSQTLTKQCLYRALAGLIEREPFLTATVFGVDSDEVVLKQVDCIDLDKIVTFDDTCTSFEQLSDSLIPGTCLPYEDPSLPVWRLYVIGKDQKELAFAFDHVCFDGGSGPLFHTKLLDQLNHISTTDSPIPSVLTKDSDAGEADATFPSMDFLPNLEKLVDMRPPWSFMLKVVGQMALQKWWPDKKWTGPPPVATMESASTFTQLDADTVGQLLKLSKSNGVTLTSLLYAVFMRAIVDSGLVPESASNHKFDCACPVNARKYISHPPGMDTALGNYVFNFHDSRFTPNDKDIFSIASKFNTNLRKALSAPTDIAYEIGLLGMINVKSYVHGATKAAARGSTAEISNLGTYDFFTASTENSSSTKKWHISSLSFTQGSSAMGAPFMLNLVSVKKGPLTLGISTCTNKQDCTSLVRAMSAIISNLTSSSSISSDA